MSIKVEIIGIFIGKQYNSSVLFCDWICNISKYYLPNAVRHFSIITDNQYLSVFSSDQINVIQINASNLLSQEITFKKFDYINLAVINKDTDFIAFIQSNVRCNSIINAQCFYNQLKDKQCIFFQHSAYDGKNYRDLFGKNSNSTLLSKFILTYANDVPYIQAAQFIFKPSYLISFMSALKTIINADKAIDSAKITSDWQDESYINYLLATDYGIRINAAILDGKTYLSNSNKNAKIYLIDKTTSNLFPLVNKRVKDPIDISDYSYVISVNDRRYEKFVAAFKQHQIQFMPKKYAGLTPKHFHFTDEISLSDQQYGIIGCAMSHVSLIKIAQALNLPFICIFEDDAMPCENCCQILSDALRNIPYDANIFVLGSLWQKTTKMHGKSCRIKKLYGSHAYIVFSNAYEKYIDIFNTQMTTVDHLLYSMPNVYCYEKNIFTQDAANEFSLHDISRYYDQHRDFSYLKVQPPTPANSKINENKIIINIIDNGAAQGKTTFGLLLKKNITNALVIDSDYIMYKHQDKYIDILQSNKPIILISDKDGNTLGKNIISHYSEYGYTLFNITVGRNKYDRLNTMKQRIDDNGNYFNRNKDLAYKIIDEIEHLDA